MENQDMRDFIRVAAHIYHPTALLVAIGVAFIHIYAL